MMKKLLATADKIGLRYATDQKPGIRRVRSGAGFCYIGANGRQIHSSRILGRLRSLAIPPAWRHVWICPNAKGHLQATGRDARGRKQYCYHTRWREARDETKFGRMIAFGKALPKIRRRTRAHLRKKGLSREKVLAAMVVLLEMSSARIGNEEYHKANHSFGLTTLQDRHARVNGARVQLHFRGKGGKEQSVDVMHPRIAKIVKRCQDLPGQDLFQYLDANGSRRNVTSGDVNAYLREITGQNFTAKDFRTWTGTLLTALTLKKMTKSHRASDTKRNIARAIELVSRKLGNTPSICKKCYVHPSILAGYVEGSLSGVFRPQTQKIPSGQSRWLTPGEAAVLNLLQQQSTASRAASSCLAKDLRLSVRRAGERKSSRSESSSNKISNL
jgi:DNA topoisomerase I